MPNVVFNIISIIWGNQYTYLYFPVTFFTMKTFPHNYRRNNHQSSEGNWPSFESSQRPIVLDSNTLPTELTWLGTNK